MLEVIISRTNESSSQLPGSGGGVVNFFPQPIHIFRAEFADKLLCVMNTSARLRKLFYPQDLLLESSCDSGGLSLVKGDTTHDGGRDSEFPGHPAVNPVIKGGPAENWEVRVTLQGQILSSSRDGLYTETNIPVKDKIRKRITPEERPELPRRVRELREGARLTQGDIARLCDVKQPTVVRWEQGKDRPPGQALIVFGRLAGEPDKWWWFEQAGLKKEDVATTQPDAQYSLVPLLKDKVAAGHGRVVNENDIDGYITFPKEWLPHSKNVTALKVSGDSMSPIIEDGYVVLIDSSQRDPRRLIGQMVAAREGDAVTIKWLRKEGKFYQLVPQHTSVRHPVRVLTVDQDFGIVGRVVKWIGEPPK
jgi:SOS-response transcriptional repressor LexA